MSHFLCVSMEFFNGLRTIQKIFENSIQCSLKINKWGQYLERMENGKFAKTLGNFEKQELVIITAQSL